MNTQRWRDKKRRNGTWQAYEQKTRERRAAKRARMTNEEVLTQSRRKNAQRKKKGKQTKARRLVVDLGLLHEELQRPFPLRPLPCKFDRLMLPVVPYQQSEQLRQIVESL